MNVDPEMNRREWLKSAGAWATVLAASGVVAKKAPAQHEVDRSAVSSEPLRLGSNENNYGPSPMAMMAAMQMTDRMLRYPHAEATELLEKISAREGVPTDRIFVGFGSADVLEGLAAWIGAQGGEVVTPALTFNFLPSNARRHGAQLVEVPLNAKHEIDLPAMAAKITGSTRCVYLVNPNNPTGTILPADALRSFVVEAAKKCLVVVDEAYLEYADDFAGRTLAPLVAEGHNVVVTRTFSKIHALAGQRIGYGLMPARIASEAFGAHPLKNGFRLNMIGVAAASASLDDSGHHEEIRLKSKAERDKFCALLKSLGRAYAEPSGSFVFFQTGLPGPEFQARMRTENIMINAGYAAMPGWARLTIGTPEEMEVVHAAVKKILG